VIQSNFRRIAALGFLIATGSAEAQGPRDTSEPTTVIVGTIRAANTRRPLVNSVVYLDDASNGGARTDSAGRFVMRTSRMASLLGVRREGYLEFQLPVLELTTDTLFADIELRTDPPAPVSNERPNFLPTLCILIEAPHQLDVFNSCNFSQLAPPGYTQKIIKHAPWNPYFGPAGDRGGVLLRKRVQPAGR